VTLGIVFFGQEQKTPLLGCGAHFSKITSVDKSCYYSALMTDFDSSADKVTMPN
jgi:hypothetical protein